MRILGRCTDSILVISFCNFQRFTHKGVYLQSQYNKNKHCVKPFNCKHTKTTIHTGTLQSLLGKLLATVVCTCLRIGRIIFFFLFSESEFQTSCHLAIRLRLIHCSLQFSLHNYTKALYTSFTWLAANL